MAGRPPKEGLDYFPFEVGFFDDDKVELLEGEHGPIGTYVFMRLLCSIYKDNGFFYAWDESARVLLARRIGALTPQKADLIVRSCVKWSLFDGTLFDAYSVLSSQGIQRRYLNAIRERAKKAAADGRQICVDGRFWLIDEATTAKSFVKVTHFSENIGNNGNFSREESNNSCEETPKVKKRREKESKGEGEARADMPSRPVAPPPAAPSHMVGLVCLAQSDYTQMCTQFGKETVDAKIIHMDSWIRNGGRMPKSCSAKLRDWLTADCTEKSAQPERGGKRVGAQQYEQRAYTDDELNALLDTDLDALNS